MTTLERNRRCEASTNVQPILPLNRSIQEVDSSAKIYFLGQVKKRKRFVNKILKFLFTYRLCPITNLFGARFPGLMLCAGIYEWGPYETTTATGTSKNKRFTEQNNNSARASLCWELSLFQRLFVAIRVCVMHTHAKS